MKRRLLNLLAALSLLISIAATALWPWSHRTERAVIWESRTLRAGILVKYGRLMMYWARPLDPEPTETVPAYFSFSAKPARGADWSPWFPVPINRLGFAYRHGVATRVSLHYAVVPLWALAAAGACLPVGWARRHVAQRRRLKRESAGLCPACGYDLRATPGRCPECGTSASVNPHG